MSAETLVERLRETVANCRNPKPKQLSPVFWTELANEIEEAADTLAAKAQEEIATGEFLDLMNDQIEANRKANATIIEALRTRCEETARQALSIDGELDAAIARATAAEATRDEALAALVEARGIIEAFVPLTDKGSRARRFLARALQPHPGTGESDG